MLYTHVKQNYKFTDEDKKEAMKMFRQIIEIAVQVRKNGLLSIDDEIKKYENPFLRKAMECAVYSWEPKRIEGLLDKYIIFGDYTGKEILELLLIREGSVAIVNGLNPKDICESLAAFFGKDLIDNTLGIYNDLSPETIENHVPYKSSEWLEKMIEMCGENLKEMPDAMDIDILDEVYNVSMGAAASALSKLLRVKGVIDIYTKISALPDSAPDFPAVGVEINYIAGLEGTMLFIFNKLDVIRLVNIWMGGKGTDPMRESEFNEMHMSAIGELMNQMMGQSSMALSGFLDMTIEIDNPNVYNIDGNYTAGDTVAAVTNLKLTVGDILDSEITAILSIPFSKTIISAAKKSFGLTNE